MNPIEKKTNIVMNIYVLVLKFTEPKRPVEIFFRFDSGENSYPLCYKYVLTNMINVSE